MVLAEQIICIELSNNILSAKFKFDKIVMRIVSDFIHHHSNIMQQLDGHGYDLCKKIATNHLYDYSCIPLSPTL